MEHSSHAAFSATLSPRDRRLAGRLEGFGDIVFGFAVSQCALQLPAFTGHVDLANVTPLVFYFGTFALIASLWMIFHRLMTGTFVPSGIDLFCAFAFLALVGLMPYALYALGHTIRDYAAARIALAEYTSIYAVMSAIAAILQRRNLRRGWPFLDASDRDVGWVGIVRLCTLGLIMATACAIDLFAGPAVGGMSLCSVPILIRLARARWPHAPAALAPRDEAAPAYELEPSRP